MVFHKQRQRHTITYGSWSCELVVQSLVGRYLPLTLINSLSRSTRMKTKLFPRADKKELFKLSQLLQQNKGFLRSELSSLGGSFQKKKWNVRMQCSQPFGHVTRIYHLFFARCCADGTRHVRDGRCLQGVHYPAGETITWFTN